MSETDTQDLKLLQAAARRAGACAVGWFSDPGEVTEKSPNHPVTQADLETDALLRDVLCKARPDYGWLSEESVDDGSRLRARRTFIVDPIDGTRAFIAGKPHFTICLAVVENGRPLSAVVYNPALEEMYCAEAGRGATCNDVPITVGTATSLNQVRMLAHDGLFSHKGWAKPWPKMHTGSRNSMAYRIALVGAGTWDACLTLQPKSDWDLAAADLIASEAGAIITDPDGQVFCYDLQNSTKAGVICAGPALHALILERVLTSRQSGQKK
jgi:myo-inositol-1(or 4)-monophosphatase